MKQKILILFFTFNIIFNFNSYSMDYLAHNWICLEAVDEEIGCSFNPKNRKNRIIIRKVKDWIDSSKKIGNNFLEKVKYSLENIDEREEGVILCGIFGMTTVIAALSYLVLTEK